MSISSEPRRHHTPQLLRRSAGVAAATAGALAPWVLAAPIAGIELEVRVGGETKKSARERWR